MQLKSYTARSLSIALPLTSSFAPHDSYRFFEVTFIMSQFVGLTKLS